MTLESQAAQHKGDQVEAMAREVEAMKKTLTGVERRAAKWKQRAIDIAKLAAISPHGNFGQGHHGNFSPGGPTQKLSGMEDSDEEIPERGGEDEEEEEDLRAIWHAAFASSTKTKQRGVSSAPGGTRAQAAKTQQGSQGANNSMNRSSTSMGLRKSLNGSRGDMRSNQFANFSLEGRNIRGDSASSKRTGASGGLSLPSVPGHVSSSSTWVGL